MALRLSKKKMPKKEEKQLQEKWKIEERVFDRPTLFSLYYLLNKGVITRLHGPISTGKEADVYRAEGKAGDLAVKIYRIETTGFQRIEEYLIGDPRFEKVGRTKRSIVYAWARKEYKNLEICAGMGISVPRPIDFKNNVIVTELIGEGGIPAPTLKEVGPTNPQREFETLIGFIIRMFSNGFVHADLSEYNVLVLREKLYLIDLAQGVLTTHPRAIEFLERDVRNVVDYYSDYIDVDYEETVSRVRASGPPQP
ncbi:MAG: serine protein kinase RIO [Candidatus Micrarchaeia archaeon]